MHARARPILGAFLTVGLVAVLAPAADVRGQLPD
jgi:hypothetical protein